jgi:hypothetical protein
VVRCCQVPGLPANGNESLASVRQEALLGLNAPEGAR